MRLTICPKTSQGINNTNTANENRENTQSHRDREHNKITNQQTLIIIIFQHQWSQFFNKQTQVNQIYWKSGSNNLQILYWPSHMDNGKFQCFTFTTKKTNAELTCVFNQLNLIDIYTPFYPSTMQNLSHT